MTLFDPSRHEPLLSLAWDEALVRRKVEEIAQDCRSAFSPESLWPIHPNDVSPERASTLKPIYYGATGVLWSLDYLSRMGVVKPVGEMADVLPSLLTAHRDDSLAVNGEPVLGFQVGDAGILLLQYRLSSSEQVADELYRVIEQNADHPAKGFVWGGAGSAMASLFMWEQTEDSRWRTLYLDLTERLWRDWSYDEEAGGFLWTVDLYGRQSKMMSALHGLPGIVTPMLRGLALLPDDLGRELVERTAQIVRRTAITEDGLANWPLAIGPTTIPDADVLRVQHCIGAPGMVNCFAATPVGDAIDDLMLAAGELIWRAGPLTKLPCLCHGVPGNGFSFLKLFERTGDQQWLDRARAFAMHAIVQNERFTTQFGTRKFSMWTGDAGLMVYLWACLEGSSDFPTIDVF
ncbi:MAG: LanC-like protein [Pseudomonadota bacterium]